RRARLLPVAFRVTHEALQQTFGQILPAFDAFGRARNSDVPQRPRREHLRPLGSWRGCRRLFLPRTDSSRENCNSDNEIPAACEHGLDFSWIRARAFT